MKKIFSTLLIACLGGFIGVGTYKMTEKEPTTVYEIKESSSFSDSNSMFSGQGKPVSLGLRESASGLVDFRPAANSTVKAVVHVTNHFVQTSYHYDPFSQFFGGDGRYQRQNPGVSSGSGVIISEDGYIVTNNHVIRGAQKLTITLDNKKTYDAEVIGTDPATDLALLKIDDSNLPFVSFGNSDNVQIGEWVLALGNPYNLTSTVTAGIVSAKARNINLLEYDPEREIFPLESFIQTDAAVNPGNSGGALVNIHGELVGVNTAIASKTGSYAGYSFAIPANIVKKVTNDLLEFGGVQRAFIGVRIREIDQELSNELGLSSPEGVYVAELMEGGAAASAGIERGDIITHVGNIQVKNVTQLQEQIGKFRPGDKIAISVLRKNNKKKLLVELRNVEGNTELISKTDQKYMRSLGASFEMVTQEEMKNLGISNGVRIRDLTAGKLRSTGMKPGFIITRIDKKPIRKPEDIVSALEGKEEGILIEGIHQNGKKGYFVIG